MRQHSALFCISVALAGAIFLSGPTASRAQEMDTVVLKAMVNRAVDLMDRNLADEAILRWDSALAMRPNYVPYKYESAICHVMAKRYQVAIERLLPIYRDSMLFDRGYQLIGNCYDFLEDSAKSMEYYTAGLARYPTSGRLHHEMGTARFIAGKLDSAVEWWVRGTQVEPSFSTNYYWVAKACANTRNKIWTVMFGEAFVNIESGTPRTKEIATMLYNTWNASMMLGDTNDPINFCSDEMLEENSAFGPNVMNFGTAFEFSVAQASQHLIPDQGVLKKLSVEQLVDVRLRLAEIWKKSGYADKYPNAMLDWNLKLQKNNWLKEYLWWILGYGNMDEMRQYFSRNEARYDTFFGWLTENPFPKDKPLCLGLHCTK